ncbi:protein-disulfide reductase DsbD [Cereibacter sphaeroides]|uniref:protein-disulfide reductase DsbD n=1 Tax=Cereibacter sphaeroides TaxID=1063 RepID=UPI00313B1A84
MQMILALRPALLSLILALGLGLLAPALAQEGGFSIPGSFSSASEPRTADEAFVLGVEPRGGTVHLSWEVTPGHYLYREFFKGTAADGSPLTLDLPEGEPKEDPTFGTMQVYHHDVALDLPAEVFPVTLTWQGCQDGGICYAPITRSVAAAGTVTTVTPAAPGAEPQGTGPRMASEPGLVESIAARGGSSLVILAFFGFGLLLAFTPCVLPMAPILLGMLSRQGESLTATRGAVLSGVYVLAMATAFGLLGVVAALSGQNLHVALQSPTALVAVAALFGLLALSSFGAFDLALPQFVTARLGSLGQGRRGSTLGAAALGFTSALIVGPCVTAPLAGALLYIAQSGDMRLGAAALFALGLGQGVPLLVAGTLGARALPRAGVWMEAVKQVFGFVFLGMAVWLLGRILPGPVSLALWALLAIGLGLALGALEPATTLRRHLARGAGVAALIAAMALGLGAAAGGDDPLQPLAGLGAAEASAEALVFAEVTDSEAMDRALPQGAPGLIYVTAAWCVTCRTIEREVLDAPEVIAALGDRTLVKADVSDFDDASQQMLDRVQSVGPPTMIFLDRMGAEAPQTRLIGDFGADEVVASAGAAR